MGGGGGWGGQKVRKKDSVEKRKRDREKKGRQAGRWKKTETGAETDTDI